MNERDVVIAPARLEDVPGMHALIKKFADRNEMLHRALSELYENLRDYYVARVGDRVVGCAAVHTVWEDLAELKGMAVDEDCQGLGIGQKLAEACLRDAAEYGVRRVFTLTLRPGFFEKVGFATTDIAGLPRKVWGECYRCPKYQTSCDEIAMTLDLAPSKTLTLTPAQSGSQASQAAMATQAMPQRSA